MHQQYWTLYQISLLSGVMFQKKSSDLYWDWWWILVKLLVAIKIPKYSTGTWWKSNCLVWGHLAASAFTNPFNCKGLERSVCYHRNTRGLKTLACALTCRGTQVKTASTATPLAVTVSFKTNYGKLISLGFLGGACMKWKASTYAFQWSGSQRGAILCLMEHFSWCPANLLPPSKQQSDNANQRAREIPPEGQRKQSRFPSLSINRDFRSRT